MSIVAKSRCYCTSITQVRSTVSVATVGELASPLIMKSLCLFLSARDILYGTYVSTDKKGLKTLIPRCHNAIYGTMVASLLYLKKICKTIKHLGFKIDPYGKRVRYQLKKNIQLFQQSWHNYHSRLD